MNLKELKRLVLKLNTDFPTDDIRVIESLLRDLGWKRVEGRWLKSEFWFDGKKVFYRGKESEPVWGKPTFLFAIAFKAWADKVFGGSGRVELGRDFIELKYKRQVFRIDSYFGVVVSGELLEGEFNFEDEVDIDKFFSSLEFLCGSGFDFTERVIYRKLVQFEKMLNSIFKKSGFDKESLVFIFRKFGFEGRMSDSEDGVSFFSKGDNTIGFRGKKDEDNYYAFLKKRESGWVILHSYDLKKSDGTLIRFLIILILLALLRDTLVKEGFEFGKFEISKDFYWCEIDYQEFPFREFGKVVFIYDGGAFSSVKKRLYTFEVNCASFTELLGLISKEWVKNFKLNCPMEG